MNSEIISSLVRHGFKPNDIGMWSYGKRNHTHIVVFKDINNIIHVHHMTALGIPVVMWDCGNDDVDDFEDYIRNVMPVR